LRNSPLRSDPIPDVTGGTSVETEHVELFAAEIDLRAQVADLQNQMKKKYLDMTNLNITIMDQNDEIKTLKENEAKQ